MWADSRAWETAVEMYSIQNIQTFNKCSRSIAGMYSLTGTNLIWKDFVVETCSLEWFETSDDLIIIA